MNDSYLIEQYIRLRARDLAQVDRPERRMVHEAGLLRRKRRGGGARTR